MPADEVDHTASLARRHADVTSDCITNGRAALSPCYVISVTSNVAARDMAEMCKLAAAGNFAEARVINQRLMPLHNKLFVEPNPIPVKWDAVNSVIHNGGISIAVPIILSFAIYIFIWLFIHASVSFGVIMSTSASSSSGSSRAGAGLSATIVLF